MLESIGEWLTVSVLFGASIFFILYVAYRGHRAKKAGAQVPDDGETPTRGES